MADKFSSVCTRKDNKIIFGINILTHVAFLFTILTCLFIFYTSKIVEDSVNNQIVDLIDYNIKSNNKENTANLLSYESLNFSVVKLKKIFSLENTERTGINNLVKSIMIVVITAFIIMLILTVLVAKNLCNNISVKEILIENIIIFVFIGIIEITFFLNIILKYIPSYPSTLSKIVINSIKKN